MTFLDLSFNSFILNISSNWMPPFHVSVPRMSSCILGPSFPSWLQSYKGIEHLDLSNSDSIPNWFWMGMPNLDFLSLSRNQFSGQITESIGEMCNNLETIDLSCNGFIGRIPSSLANCSLLNALDLISNNLSGATPNSLGQLPQLTFLHLNDNQLSGKLPSSFMNLSNLVTLDLGNNELSGGVPSWIGDGFPNLPILNLRCNAFYGQVPHDLSKLGSLQVQDLGENDLSGSIPSSFGDLKAVTQDKRTDDFGWDMVNLEVPIVFLLSYVACVNYQDRLFVNAKGQSLKYTNTLSLVTSIDLSGNNLSGAIPHEITKLAGLM